MSFLSGWFQRPPILATEQPKGPWGGGEGGGGPRNPWSVPPKGSKPTALDEFLKKARVNVGGGGGGRGPNFSGANARSLWLIGAAIILVAWVVFTSFHAIGPQQMGVVTYFGRYSGTLDPGIRPTLPAPFASVRVVDVQAIRTENFPENSGENLVLTRDQNIVDLAYSVRWNVSNPEDYVFQIADPEATVRATAEAAMREVVANVTLDQALTSGKPDMELQVQERMQRVLDDYRSGVRIQGVAIKQAVPPERVNDAFKAVSAAQSDANSMINEAQTYSQRKVALAQGEAAAFDRFYAEYKLAPEVTRRRMYYETMEDVLSRADKTLVETPGVAPFLPLNPARRLPEPEAAQPPAQAQQGAGQ